MTNLQIGSSLVFVSKDTSWFNNILFTSASPWDLYTSDTNYKQAKETNSKKKSKANQINWIIRDKSQTKRLLSVALIYIQEHQNQESSYIYNSPILTRKTTKLPMYTPIKAYQLKN